MDYNQNNVHGNQQNNGYAENTGYNQGVGYNQNNMNNSYFNGNMQGNPYYNPQQMGVNQNYHHNYILTQQRFLKLREQKNEIRKYANAFALAMLGFIVASYFISFMLMFGNLMEQYENNSTFSSSVGIFYSLLAVGLPFLLVNKYLSKNRLLSDASTTIYSAPKNLTKTICLILFGVAACIAAMYITSFITIFFNALGFEVSAGGEPEVRGVTDVIAMFLGTAIIPPLVEEFAMRNVLMQPLRKYGNAFAILASAICFGIFHGTPTQIPFAFLCGLFIGYAVVATESIWTGVIIHAIVNALSCVYFGAVYFTDEDTGDGIYSILTSALSVAGALALVFYITKYKGEYTRIMNFKGLADYSTAQKVKMFIFTPMMIIAIIVFFIQALGCITPMTSVTT